jgi:hypothetical protein
MRRSVGVLAVSLSVVSVVACDPGSWDPGGIEFHLAGPDDFTLPQEQATIPFTATGHPVDEAVVCANGTTTIHHLESKDGEITTEQEWADRFDVARENEGTAELYSFQDFECADESGGFSMKIRSRFDFSSFEFEGEHDVGFWEIEEGTGAYANLSGSGDITIDWDNEDVKYDGDAR